MGATEVTRVANHEFVVELPLASEWIVRVRDRDNFFVIGPIGDDVNWIPATSHLRTRGAIELLTTTLTSASLSDRLRKTTIGAGNRTSDEGHP